MPDDERLGRARDRHAAASARVKRAKLSFGASPRYPAWLAQFRLNRTLRARAVAEADLHDARRAARTVGISNDAPGPSAAGVASQRLVRLAQAVTAQERVSIGAVIDRLGPSSLGLVLLILTIPAIIPIPGPVGMVLGSCLALVALQVIAGARRVWLPNWLRRRSLPTRFVMAAITRIVPWLERFERRLSPRRWMVLSGRLARPFLGLAIFAMAVIITLPIPFGNILPVVALAMLALALLERDGLAVIWALVMSLVAIVWTIGLVLFGARIIEALWSLFA
ncbi:exopolysaccharide biosynthesis protein [Bosea thiooxidans]